MVQGKKPKPGKYAPVHLHGKLRVIKIAGKKIYIDQKNGSEMESSSDTRSFTSQESGYYDSWKMMMMIFSMIKRLTRKRPTNFIEI